MLRPETLRALCSAGLTAEAIAVVRTASPALWSLPLAPWAAVAHWAAGVHLAAAAGATLLLVLLPSFLQTRRLARAVKTVHA